jgi:hypothetical protein
MYVTNVIRALYCRWISKSPKNAKHLTNISIALAVIIGMPEFLDYLEIQVPHVLAPAVSKLASLAGMISAILFKLTVAPDKDDTNQNDHEENLISD